MSSPSPAYSKKASLKVRPMGEWRGLMVLAPEQPNIYLLNQTSGLVLEMCDGRTRDQLKEQFLKIVGEKVDAAKAEKIFDESLALLEQRGLVNRIG